MAPVNFEKNIREKLQERELEPSSAVWDKLSTQLGEPEEKSGKSFFWLAIAASLVGVLLISAYFLTKNQHAVENQLVKDATNEQVIDVSPIKKGEKRLDIIGEGSLLTSEISKEEPLLIDVSNSAVLEKSGIEKKKLNVVAEKTKSSNNNRSQDAIAITQEMNPSQKLPFQATIKSQSPHTKELFIDHKVNQVVASVQEIQSKNKAVSMGEIDALLAQAQREIAMERILSTTKVDAEALLMDVELDLERTFRDRVFYALGEGFDYLKSTVVNGHN